MRNFIIQVCFIGFLILQTGVVHAQEARTVIKSQEQTQEEQHPEQTQTQNGKVTQSAAVSKFKGLFKRNEQKPKRMRSKDIVKTKAKIRKQEFLRRQKENEIKFLERKLQEKQKTLDRLEG